MKRFFVGAIGVMFFSQIVATLPHINFKNYKNNCYMHAGLQALFHTKNLTEVIVKLTDKEVDAYADQIKAEQLPRDVKSQVSFNIDSARAIFKSFVKLIKDLHNGIEIEKGDADYFWKTFVDSFEAYNKAAREKGSNLGEFEKGKMCESAQFISVLLKHFLPDDLVKAVFGQNYETTNEFSCGAVETVKDSRKIGAAEVGLFMKAFGPENVPMSFNEFLEDFIFQKKIFDEESTKTCPKCHALEKITKRALKWLPHPVILSIYLNRGETGGDICRDPFEFPVQFEVKKENIKDPLVDVFYDLYAIIIHTGVHYYTYAKDWTDNSWWCFNDMEVAAEKLTNEQVDALFLDSDGYSSLLLYRFNEIRYAQDKAQYEGVTKSVFEKYTPDVVKKALKRFKRLIGVKA